MSGDRIAFYHRRLDEERRAATIAGITAIARVHQDFVRQYEERLILERFGVDTAAELPSSFLVMARSLQGAMR